MPFPLISAPRQAEVVQLWSSVSSVLATEPDQLPVRHAESRGVGKGNVEGEIPLASGHPRFGISVVTKGAEWRMGNRLGILCRTRQ